MIRMNRRQLVGSMLALPLVACGGGGGSGGKQMVAFSQANNAEPYRAAQIALMERLFAEDANVNLVVSDGQQDNSRQIGQIETFIRQRPAVLIVAPNERTALTRVMGQAMSEGIKVICLERDIAEPNYSTYIRIDNREIGRMAGRFIVEELTRRKGGARGNVVILRGLLGVEAQINRDEGAREIFAQHPEIRILADPVADWIQARAKDRMTEVLRTQPQIDVVYGHNDPMAIGANLAARELGRDGEMFFVGVDGLGGPAGGIKKVQEGVLAATFIYPLGMREAVEQTRRIIADPNYTPPKQIDLTSTMVTPANAAQLYEQTTVS